VEAVIDVLNADDRRWVRHVRKREQGHGEQRPIRQVLGRNPVPSLSRPQQQSAVTVRRGVEHDAVELGQPAGQLGVDRVEPLGFAIAKRVEYAGQTFPRVIEALHGNQCRGSSDLLRVPLEEPD
jgi:hypothetical protein